MSFNAGPGLESGASSQGDFDSKCQEVTEGLENLSGSINNIRRLLKASNNNKSNSKFEERLKKSTENAAFEFKNFGEDIRALTEWDAKSLSPKQRFTQEKLNKEFSNIVNEFKALQRQAQEAKVQQRQTQSSLSEENETTPLMSEAQQQQYTQPRQQQQVLDVVNQDDVDFQSTLVSEREDEIRGIQQGITEINSIFKDLGTLVNEQGVQIDTVEENISNLAQNSENAAKQLNQANEYQKKRRNWSCCVLIVLIVVLTIILLVVSL